MDFEFKFDCEPCSGSQAPSRDQLRCLSCSGGSIDSATKMCTCSSSQYASDLATDGSRGSSISCNACPAGSFSKKADPWTCVPCPDSANMEFSTATNKCECKSGYTESGIDSCVLTEDYEQLNQEGFVQNVYNLITYQDIVNSHGRVEDPVTIESDVMS